MLKSVLVIFMFIALVSNSQVEETIGLRHTMVYSSTDYFYQLACVTNRERFQFVPFLGFGINRTIFQQRFYPEAGLQLAYITTQRKIRVLPYTQLSFNRLRITNNSAHYWINGELGIRAEFHNKNDFGIQMGYRILNELWRLNKQMDHSTGFGYTAGIYLKF